MSNIRIGDVLLRLRVELAVEPSPAFTRLVSERLATPQRFVWWRSPLVQAASLVVAVTAASWWVAPPDSRPAPSLSVVADGRPLHGAPVSLADVPVAVGTRASRRIIAPVSLATSAGHARVLGPAEDPDTLAEARPLFEPIAFTAVPLPNLDVWTVEAAAPFQAIEFPTVEISRSEFTIAEFTKVVLPVFEITAVTPPGDRGGRELPQ